MPPDYVNRAEVRERVARLLDEYGREGVFVSCEAEEPQASFDRIREYAEVGYLGGAYCWTVRTPEQHPALSESMPEDASTAGDRVLLALGRHDETWGPPGGGREDGETFEDAAEREVPEETGVDCTATDLVAIRRVVVEDPNSADEVHLAYALFEAAYVGGTIDVQESEVAGAAWFGELPDPLHEFAAAQAAAWSP